MRTAPLYLYLSTTDVLRLRSPEYICREYFTIIRNGANSNYSCNLLANMVSVKWIISQTLLASTVFAKRKVFIDNDGLTALNVVLPLLGDMEIVGVSASFGDPSLVDALGVAADILANYSIDSCIPLYAGAKTPLLRTKKTFDIWQQLYGEFVWKGAWRDHYVDAYNLSDISYDDSTPAAMALINAVKESPGEVEIYAAGLLTTVAQAVSMWPEIVEHVKALWLMGGYIDGQYDQVTGGDLVDDINTDFNFMFDPEAAQMVLTAGFKDIYIGGNVTNYIYPTQNLFDSLVNKFGYENITLEDQFFAISEFVGNNNASLVSLPLWDEAVSAFMAFPELIEETMLVSAAVDTSFNSPFYGNLRLWPANNAPAAGTSGNVTYVNSVNAEALLGKIGDALALDWTDYCSAKGPASF